MCMGFMAEKDKKPKVKYFYLLLSFVCFCFLPLTIMLLFVMLYKVVLSFESLDEILNDG